MDPNATWAFADETDRIKREIKGRALKTDGSRPLQFDVDRSEVGVRRFGMEPPILEIAK